MARMRGISGQMTASIAGVEYAAGDDGTIDVPEATVHVLESLGWQRVPDDRSPAAPRAPGPLPSDQGQRDLKESHDEAEADAARAAALREGETRAKVELGEAALAGARAEDAAKQAEAKSKDPAASRR